MGIDASLVGFGGAPDGVFEDVPANTDFLQGRYRSRSSLVSDGLAIALSEKRRLENEGFCVRGCLVEGSRPSIEIEFSPRLKDLLEEGGAVFYAFGRTASGQPYRLGQLAGPRAALVWWKEMGFVTYPHKEAVTEQGS